MKILTAIILLLVPSLSYARHLRNWSYAELKATADVVLIAVPEKVTKTKDEEAYKVDVFGNPDKVRALVTKTKFSVQTVISGKSEDHIVLHHHRTPEELSADNRDEVIAFSINAPKYLDFIPKDRVCYLMFLTRMPNGEYEAVSGQIDPWIAIKSLGDFPYVVPPDKVDAKRAEQGGADEPATAPQLESSGIENPNPESKPRPQ